MFDLVENPDNPSCPQLSYNNSGSTSTILTLTNPAQGDGYFYIPIPAGTYNSLSIYLTTYENSYANATLGDGSPITISQNAIFPFRTRFVHPMKALTRVVQQVNDPPSPT